jgi:hypothetical protein
MRWWWLATLLGTAVLSFLLARLVMGGSGAGEAGGAEGPPQTVHPAVEREFTAVAEDAAKPRFYGQLGPFNIMPYTQPSYDGLSQEEKERRLSEQHLLLFGVPCQYPIRSAPLLPGSPFYLPLKGTSPTTGEAVTHYGECSNGVPYSLAMALDPQDYPQLGPMTVDRFPFGRLPVNVPGWINAPLDRLQLTSIRGKEVLVEKPYSTLFPTTRLLVIERRPSPGSYGIVTLLTVDAPLEEALAKAERFLAIAEQHLAP